MQKEFKFSIQDNEKTLNFIAIRLEPFEQWNFILRIIGIVSKGSLTNSAQVEQVLHNIFQTGKEVENVKSKADVNTFALVLDAIKGALATLSDNDRDWLLTELLKNVKIDKGQSYIITATIDELNNELSGFKPIFKLLAELVKINLGFL
jgi:hypothetical protein